MNLRRLPGMFCGLLLAACLAPAETKVLENFTLIDGTGNKPLANAGMVVTDGRITYVGAKAGAKAAAGAERIDLTGKFVMPGIINLHGHLGNTLGLVQDPKNFTRQNLGDQLKTYAKYGVTGVMSMGSDTDLVFEVRAAQRSGRPNTARIYTAGRGFTGAGGYPTKAPGMKGVPYEVTTAGEVDKAIAELAKKKVDLVKIWVDDHLGKEQKIPLNISQAIISAAHRNGLRVGAHIFYLQDAEKLVEAGLNGLAHSVRDKPVSDGLILAMKKRGAWQQAATLTREVSTFVYAKPHPFLDDAFFTKSIDAKTLATLKSAEYIKKAAADPDLPLYPGFLAMAQKNLKKLVESGVKVGFGTDTGPPARFSGYFEQWEMELMVESGLTPMQVITIATHNSADFLGVLKDLGTLEKGKWADLVVLGKNPLDNIRNTRSIETVWVAGNKAN
ncbi:MAG: amidohydrolase family protein [Acidobacteriia bacterium]|nr:amidohydrolase family protein [Terriglobia bacterium]